MTVPELLGRLPGGRHGGADAGVVDQDVDPAELVHRGVDEGRHWSGSATSVATVSARRPASRPAAAVSASRSTRRAPRATSAPASARRLRERDAEPAGGAGHDRDLAVEPEHVENSHGLCNRSGVVPEACPRAGPGGGSMGA